VFRALYETNGAFSAYNRQYNTIHGGIMALRKTPSADVKRKTRRYFEISLVLSLFLLVAAFKFFPDLEQKIEILKSSEEIIKMDDIANTKQESKPPPPPRPPIPIESVDAESLPDIEIGEVDLGEDRTPPPPPIKKDDPVQEDEEFFSIVEDQPEIIGGLRSIQERLDYPQLAIRAGIEGPVVVLAYVDKTGNVVKAEIQKGIGGGCDEEALKQVLKAKFSPGMQRGRPVNTKVSVRLRFVLTSE
jgi:periplasmic protein TonB